MRGEGGRGWDGGQGKVGRGWGGIRRGDGIGEGCFSFPPPCPPTPPAHKCDTRVVGEGRGQHGGGANRGEGAGRGGETPRGIIDDILCR